MKNGFVQIVIINMMVEEYLKINKRWLRMSKEDKMLSKLSLLLIEMVATYTATTKEGVILTRLFKDHNALLKAHYEG